MVVESEVIGAFIVGSTIDRVTIAPRRIALSRTLANLSALTARNAMLYEELNAYSAELKESLSERIRIEEERAKLQEDLFQAQKMESIGRLAGGVAHDFNNMLNVILGYTELAMDNLPKTSPIYANLTEVDKAARRSAEITRQLLAFARKQPISPKILNLNEAIESMLKMLRRLLGEDIDLEWKPNPKPVLVYMDPTQLDQILANLCLNARDAVDGVGKLTIETELFTFDEEYCASHQGFLPGEYSMLAVSDNGKGIEAEQLANLFDPFYTTKESGTGLGLATVYGIIRQNDGFINVYSEPETGTTFKAYMPRKSGTPHTIEIHTDGEVPTGNGEILLVVEDDPSILELSILILEGLGYEVIGAASPTEAIEKIEENACNLDLLLTDVVMPGMTGKELAKQIEQKCDGVKVLYMSGYTSNVIAHRGVLDEGVNFLQKPFSREALALKVQEALGK
ncbi:MAG: hybrid sensor histidine kinase/response regulator [Deltaproteobacteria bacterium]|nr:MAG: hybrid sensor histidine kinase/response regulator [Deltaproteobacteria bacterium]